MGSKMFVSPPAIKFMLIHWMAFSIASLVANCTDDENIKISPLKAIMLNESFESSFERAADRAFFVSSSSFPRMLPLISTTNTTSFLKTYEINWKRWTMDLIIDKKKKCGSKKNWRKKTYVEQKKSTALTDMSCQIKYIQQKINI